MGGGGGDCYLQGFGGSFRGATSALLRLCLLSDLGTGTRPALLYQQLHLIRPSFRFCVFIEDSGRKKAFFKLQNSKVINPTALWSLNKMLLTFLFSVFFFFQHRKENQRVWKVKKEDLQRQTTDEEDNEAKIDCSKVACMNVPFYCRLTNRFQSLSFSIYFSNEKKERRKQRQNTSRIFFWKPKEVLVLWTCLRGQDGRASKRKKVTENQWIDIETCTFAANFAPRSPRARPMTLYPDTLRQVLWLKPWLLLLLLLFIGKPQQAFKASLQGARDISW